MTADIITIGDEILIGQIVDTNSTWIANQLESVGVQVRQITSISDEKEHILSTLEASLKASDLVILTGGLGPTNDDITKHALCEFFQDELVMDERVLNDVQTLFAKFGRRMNLLNEQQAMIPSKCRVFRNTKGTAPGMCFEKEEKMVLSLPGVPFEMKHLMQEFIPFLQDKYHLPHIIHQLVVLRGIVESHLAELLEEWELAIPKEIKLAYLPSKGYIKLRLTARGSDRLFLEKAIKEQLEKLRQIAGEYFCVFQVLKNESIIAELLKKNNSTLATAESCTGGNIAHRITSIAGSSAYFKGSVVAYSEEVKRAQLGVSLETIALHHVVSEEVVKEMAQGVKNKLGVDYALATSGIAGPDGGEKNKPVGTVCIALATPFQTIAQTYYFTGSRCEVIEKATEKALWMLKESLENK